MPTLFPNKVGFFFYQDKTMTRKLSLAKTVDSYGTIRIIVPYEWVKDLTELYGIPIDANNDTPRISTHYTHDVAMYISKELVNMAVKRHVHTIIGYYPIDEQTFNVLMLLPNQETAATYLKSL